MAEEAKKDDVKVPSKHNVIKLTVHPAADVFPMMPDAELQALADSIKEHGLREKLVVTTDGVLVDGRNRFAAMNLAEIGLKSEHVTIVDFEQAPYSVEEYVVMANIERRNLTREQRKELAGKLALMMEAAQEDKPKDEKVDTTKKAADVAGVSRRTAADAKKATLVSLGLKKPETALPAGQSRKKTTTKVDQKPARPPSVTKALTQARDNILITGKKWPADRAEQAVALCLDIIAEFPEAAAKMQALRTVNAA
jgi:uncharacterized tellurite resistance protein B-like protein